jgi:hypothetical protein
MLDSMDRKVITLAIISDETTIHIERISECLESGLFDTKEQDILEHIQDCLIDVSAHLDELVDREFVRLHLDERTSKVLLRKHFLDSIQAPSIDV